MIINKVFGKKIKKILDSNKEYFNNKELDYLFIKYKKKFQYFRQIIHML